MVYYAYCRIGTEISPRERKDSSEVDNSGDGSLSGYGRHVFQRDLPLISDRSQNRGIPKADKNGDPMEPTADE